MNKNNKIFQKLNKKTNKFIKKAMSSKQKQDIRYLTEKMGFTKEYLQELLNNWEDAIKYRYKEVMDCSESEIKGAIIDCEFIIYQEEEIDGEYYDKEIDLNGSKILEFKNYGNDSDIKVEYNGNIIDTSAGFYDCYLDRLNNTVVNSNDQHIDHEELL